MRSMMIGGMTEKTTVHHEMYSFWGIMLTTLRMTDDERNVRTTSGPLIGAEMTDHARVHLPTSDPENLPKITNERRMIAQSGDGDQKACS